MKSSVQKYLDKARDAHFKEVRKILKPLRRTKVKNHRHQYRVSGHTSKELWFRCTLEGCAKQVKRRATKSEARKLSSHFKKWISESFPMHKLWHSFTETFCKKETDEKGCRLWKWKGYPLMQRVDKWRKKNPEVMSVKVDDAVHAGSRLIFIPHEDDYTYMGCTVVYIPQCTGEDPICFFLYPCHIAFKRQPWDDSLSLLDALQVLMDKAAQERLPKEDPTQGFQWTVPRKKREVKQ